METKMEKADILKQASLIADKILGYQAKKYCRHKWINLNIHDTIHWLNGEKCQICNKCKKERWVSREH